MLLALEHDISCCWITQFSYKICGRCHSLCLISISWCHDGHLNVVYYFMQDGSYSDTDKQVGRVLKESDGLYENECGWYRIVSCLITMLMPLMILVMKMVKVAEKNYWWKWQPTIEQYTRKCMILDYIIFWTFFCCYIMVCHTGIFCTEQQSNVKKITVKSFSNYRGRNS
jgi:hypothetical protein